MSIMLETCNGCYPGDTQEGVCLRIAGAKAPEAGGQGDTSPTK